MGWTKILKRFGSTVGDITQEGDGHTVRLGAFARAGDVHQRSGDGGGSSTVHIGVGGRVRSRTTGDAAVEVGSPRPRKAAAISEKDDGAFGTG